MSSYQKSRITIDQEPMLLELLRFKWKRLSFEERNDHYNWRYNDNPYTSRPYLILGYDENLALGSRSFVLQKFTIRNRMINVFSPADAIIHPNYRRKGLFGELTTVALSVVNDDFGADTIFLNLSSNKSSTSGNLKQGWKVSNGIKDSLYKINVFNLLKIFVCKGKKNSCEDTYCVFDKDLRYEICNQLYITKIVKLNNENRDPNVLTNIRDEAFYTWRYNEPKQVFHYVYCWAGEDLKAYMIFSQCSGYISILEEYGPANTEIISRIFKKLSGRMPWLILKTISVSEHQKRFLRQIGFVKPHGLLSKVFGKEMLPVLVRPGSGILNDNAFYVEGIDIRDMENWGIFQADIH